MAAQALSSDLFPSMLCSSGIVFSGDESSSIDCKLPTDQMDAGLNSTVISADRIVKLMQQFVGGIESKVLDAFKQALSDIIDHLAKEAATRVVMAERKASKLDQELIHVKQQALAMLLHMKRSTDLQIAETEREREDERKRADDAENELFALQGNVERVKGELKRKEAMIETTQKLREEGIRSSPWNDKEYSRNVKIKLDQPQLDMDNLLLFAGVACEDANTRCGSFMPDLSSKTCRSQSFVSLPPSNKLVAKNSIRNVLRNGEQCHDLHKEDACICAQEQALPNKLATGTSFLKETSFQPAQMQSLKGVQNEQMLLSSKGTRKSKAALKNSINDSKPAVHQTIKEVDHHRINPIEVKSLDPQPVFESIGGDFDNVGSFNVNVAEGQTGELLLPVSTNSKKHVPTISSANDVVVGDDDQMSSLPHGRFQRLANGSKPVYENPGICSQMMIAQNTGKVMTNPSLNVDSSLLCPKEIAHKNSKGHKIGCAGQSSVYCAESILKRENESSKVHLDPDESETMEVEQALQSFAEGIELPHCNSVHIKPFEEPTADGSSHSISPNMDADSNVSECGVVVDNKHSRAQCETDASGKRSWHDLSGTHDAKIQQGQLNEHNNSEKQKNEGDKCSSETPDISLKGARVKESRALQPKTQSGSSHPARTKSNHKSSEAHKSLNLTVESSRESRRLMQGARQLLMLAERKWL